MQNKTQVYSNHRRLVPGFHYVTYSLLIAVSISAAFLFYRKYPENLLEGSWYMLVSLVLCLLAVFARSFALKAQDRAIRSEENFRHFLLTGKPLDSRLRLSQIIALRFASDEEFVDLTIKAAGQQLKANEIKKLIKNWRGDFNRV